MSKTPAYIAAHLRRVLLDGASAPHTSEVQHFFKDEIQSRGWYTGELRKVAVRFRRSIVAENGQNFLVQVADRLFRGQVLEEKILAVTMFGTWHKPSYRSVILSAGVLPLHAGVEGPLPLETSCQG
jgi:hypothetical protein